MAAAKDARSDVQYIPDIIQKKFLRSVSTGLLSDRVLLKTLMGDLVVTDETLIEKINDAAAVDWEGQQKLKKTITTKPARINELRTETTAYQLHDYREAEFGPPSEHSTPCQGEC